MSSGPLETGAAAGDGRGGSLEPTACCEGSNEMKVVALGFTMIMLSWLGERANRGWQS